MSVDHEGPHGSLLAEVVLFGLVGLRLCVHHVGAAASNQEHHRTSPSYLDQLPVRAISGVTALTRSLIIYLLLISVSRQDTLVKNPFAGRVNETAVGNKITSDAKVANDEDVFNETLAGVGSLTEAGDDEYYWSQPRPKYGQLNIQKKIDPQAHPPKYKNIGILEKAI